MTAGVGTPEYSAPEINDENENYSQKSDIFSIGLISKLFDILNNTVVYQVANKG